MAPIQQTANQLVKVYSNGKKVITEALGNGRTLTKIFNADGSLILERTKSVSGIVDKGEKRIIQTDRVVKDATGTVYNNKSERVYRYVDGKKFLIGAKDKINGRNNVSIPNYDGTNQIYISLSNGINKMINDFLAMCKVKNRNVLDRSITASYGTNFNKIYKQQSAIQLPNINKANATSGASELWF